MFCPECGVKNPDNAIFCQECGSRIEEVAPVIMPQANELPQMPQNYIVPQPMPVQPAKPAGKLRKLILLELVLLCVAAAFTYNYGKKLFSPEKTAELHFLKVVNGDWQGVYNDFDIVESQFINESNFVQTQKSRGATLINTYKVSDADRDYSTLGASVDISYRLKGNTENAEYSVAMNKQAEKNFGLFDSWKVDPSSYICYDYNITVPTGAKVIFEGEELSSNYITEENNGWTYYNIPQLFYGNYDILVTQDYMEDVKAVVSTYDGGYYVNEMYLKEETKEELIREAGKSFEEIYKAGFSNASFDQIASMFSEEHDVREYMESDYSNFVYNLGLDDETGLRKVDFNNVTGSASHEVYDGKNYVYVDINYEYTATYTSYDWWTSDISTNTYSDYGSTQFTYVLENEKWVLASTSFNRIYY